jgi:hypothetical protein
MIDKNLIGHEFEAVTLPVEEGRLRFVAKSIGETNPIYSDPEAARKAGHPALPAPPTFVFMLEVDAVDLQDLVSFFGCKLGQLLHGEQGFVYHEFLGYQLSSAIFNLFLKYNALRRPPCKVR